MKKIPYSIICILILGAILRLAVFFLNNSLWQDEIPVASFLALNNWGEITQPILNGEIITPLGFLAVTKGLCSVFGYNEYILRLFPLFCGFLSILLLYDVAKRLIRPAAVTWAMLLFATAYYIVGFSAECKQYSSDVLFTLLIVRCMLWLKTERVSILHLISIILVSAGSIWFSFTSVFIVFALGLVFLIRAVSHHNDRRIREIILIWICWIAGVLVYFDSHLIQSLSTGGHRHLHNWWISVGGFPQFIPLNIKSLLWPLKAGLHFFENPISLYPTFGFVLFVIGVIWIYRREREILSNVVDENLLSASFRTSFMPPFS